MATQTKSRVTHIYHATFVFLWYIVSIGGMRSDFSRRSEGQACDSLGLGSPMSSSSGVMGPSPVIKLSIWKVRGGRFVFGTTRVSYPDTTFSSPLNITIDSLDGFTSMQDIDRPPSVFSVRAIPESLSEKRLIELTLFPASNKSGLKVLMWSFWNLPFETILGLPASMVFSSRVIGVERTVTWSKFGSLSLSSLTGSVNYAMYLYLKTSCT